jgi:hypothetical protein
VLFECSKGFIGLDQDAKISDWLTNGKGWKANMA